MLPPGAARTESASRADTGHTRRAGDGRNCAGVSGAGGHDGPAAGAHQAARFATPGFPIRCPTLRAHAGAVRRRVDGDLLGLQRGLHGDAWRNVGPPDLCSEHRLGRLMRELMLSPPPGEATGLFALMLLHDSRRAARLDEAGNLVLLEEQDRARWKPRTDSRSAAAGGGSIARRSGAVCSEAALAAEHCRAARAEDTDWRTILRLYDLLGRVQPSPIVEFNRAVGVAMVAGPRAALALLMSWPFRAISTVTTCSMRRVPICCDAAGCSNWRRKAMNGRSSNWSAMMTARFLQKRLTK